MSPLDRVVVLVDLLTVRVAGGDSGATGSKASGIKIAAQVLGDLAAVRPQVVLSLLPHLESKRSMVRQEGHPGDNGWAWWP